MDDEEVVDDDYPDEGDEEAEITLWGLTRLTPHAGGVWA